MLSQRIHIRFAHVILFTLFLTLCCCTKSNNNRDLLLEAEQLIQEHPDEAVNRLQSIGNLENLSKADYANYLLLKVQAFDRAGIDISSDTLMYIPISFFVEQKDTLNAVKAYLYAGRVCIAKHKEEEAMNYLLYARDLVQESLTEVPCDSIAGQIYYNIGCIYQANRNYVRALDYFRQAKYHFSRSESREDENLINYYMANIFVKESKPDSALFYYNQVAKYVQKEGNKEYMALLEREIACVYLDMKEYDKAKQNAEASMEKDSDNQQLLWNYWILSNCLLNEGKVDDALKYAEKMPTCEQWKDAEAKLSYHHLMSEIWEKKGNTDKALYANKEASELQDFIFKTAINSSIPYMEELHQKKRVEDEYLQIQNQRLKLIITIVILVSLVILVIGYMMYRVKRKQNELLEAEKTMQTFKEMLAQREVELVNYDQQLSEQEHHYKQILSKQDEDGEQLRRFLMDKLDIARKLAQMNIVTTDNTTDFMKQFRKIFGQDVMDWSNIYPLINSLYNNFVDKIKEAYPHLSEKDQQLCCFIRAGFRSDEQAVLLGYTQNSIRVKRTQLVKKMGFANAEEFTNHLMNV